MSPCPSEALVRRNRGRAAWVKVRPLAARSISANPRSAPRHQMECECPCFSAGLALLHARLAVHHLCAGSTSQDPLHGELQLRRAALLRQQPVVGCQLRRQSGYNLLAQSDVNQCGLSTDPTQCQSTAAGTPGRPFNTKFPLSPDN